METDYYSVKTTGNLTALVRAVASNSGKCVTYGALLQMDMGTRLDEQHCEHNHRSLKAAKRCASSMKWQGVKSPNVRVSESGGDKPKI